MISLSFKKLIFRSFGMLNKLNMKLGWVKKSFMVVLTFLIVLPAYASNNSYNFDNLTSGNKNIGDSMNTFTGYFIQGYNFLKSLGVLVGLVMIFAGITKLKKANESNGQISAMSGIWLIVLGGAMASISAILLIMAATVQS